MDQSSEPTQLTTDSAASASVADSGAVTTTKDVAPQVTAPASGLGGTVTEAPAYTPNYKYNFRDKELEFDEFIRPAIKDAETEKKIRDLYTAAKGLEEGKTNYAAASEQVKELTPYKEGYQKLYDNVAEVMQYKNNGDLDTFFQKVDLPAEKVAEWILSKLQRQNLPPEQRQVYDELDTKRRSEVDYQRRLQAESQRAHEVSSQMREWQLDREIEKPEVRDIATRYDSAKGQGAFKRLVAEHGVLHHSMHGEDPSVETVVATVLQRFGDSWRPQPSAPAVSTNPEPQLPVIPNVSGKNVSPSRKTPRSVDDLRSLAKEMSA